MKKIADCGYGHKHLDDYVELLDKVTDNLNFNTPLIMHQESHRSITLIEYQAIRLSKSGECDMYTGE